MRKTRSDSLLLNLPEAQQAELAQWLLDGMPYHKAQELVQREFSVTVKSLTSFSRFWEEVCQPYIIVKRQRAAHTADDVAAEASKNPNQFDAATIDHIKQKAFELAIAPNAKASDIKAIFNLVLKSRDQDLEGRRIAILEAKAQQADEAEAVTKSSLSPEEQAARIRAIFQK